MVNNVLDAVNAPAYTSLMETGQSVGESLLDTSERYGLYLATTVLGAAGVAGGEMTITRNNIGELGPLGEGIYIQWNLRIKDTWGPEQVSFIRRCPLFGG